MPEKKPEIYDFNFICLSFGLIPINGDSAAIMPGAIVDMQYDRDSESWTLTLHGGKEYELSDPHMAELERNIKRRSEETKALQREAMKAHGMMQMEIAAELQAGPSLSKARLDGIPIIGKRFKQ